MSNRQDTSETQPEAREPDGRPPLITLPLLALYLATLAAQLVSLAFGRVDEDLSFGSLVVPSVFFLSLVTLPAIWLGLALGPGVGLGAPLLNGLLSRESRSLHRLGREALLAAVLGVALGGLLLLIRQVSTPCLPPEIPAYGHRGVAGGLAVSLGAAVAEEVWFRLGLMTLLVWGGARLLQDRTPRPTMVWAVLVLSSVAFGLAHLPQLISYGAGSPFAVGGTVAGNAAVGILYGWCYWKRSLIAAMVAHFFVDLMIHVLPATST